MINFRKWHGSLNATLIIIAIMIVFPVLLNAQALPGTTGYFNIPSAEINPDKTMSVGANLLHKKYKKWGNEDHHGGAFFVTTTFIPRVELSIRYSRMLDLTSEDYKSTVGDRMASIRIQPLKEGKHYPSVVFGLQNFFTTLESGDASHFNSSYIVMTKNFKLPKIIERIGVTAGYGAEIFQSADYQFIGLFYGLSISPKNMDYLELMVEYDAEKWNAGMRLTIVKHVVILAGFEGMDSLSGGISYKFMLP